MTDTRYIASLPPREAAKIRRAIVLVARKKGFSCKDINRALCGRVCDLLDMKA